MIEYTAVSKSFNRNDCEELNKYLQKKTLGKGRYGHVQEVCKKKYKDCDYALKIIKVDREDRKIYPHSSSFNTSEQYLGWENEVEILHQLNECQDYKRVKLVPKLIDAWYCNDKNDRYIYFYILMEKYNGTLKGFLKLGRYSEAIKIALITALENLYLKLRILHDDCNICLNDIHLDNILYKKVGEFKYEFVFADVGNAIFVCHEEDKRDDERALERAINKFEKNLT